MLHQLAQTLASLSLICNIAITLNILTHPKLHTFPFKLISTVIISQSFHSISTLMGNVRSPLLCGLQSAMRSFSQFSMISWSVATTFTVFLIVTKHRMGTDRYFKSYFIIITVCCLYIRSLNPLQNSYIFEKTDYVLFFNRNPRCYLILWYWFWWFVLVSKE